MNVYWEAFGGSPSGYTILRPDLKIGETFRAKGRLWKVISACRSSRWMTVLDLNVKEQIEQ